MACVETTPENADAPVPARLRRDGARQTTEAVRGHVRGIGPPRADTPVGVPREIAAGVAALGALPVRFTGLEALDPVEVTDDLTLGFEVRQATLVDYVGEPGCPVGLALELDGVVTASTARGLTFQRGLGRLIAFGPDAGDAWLSSSGLALIGVAEPYVTLMGDRPCEGPAETLTLSLGAPVGFEPWFVEPLGARPPVALQARCTPHGSEQPFLVGNLDAP